MAIVTRIDAINVLTISNNVRIAVKYSTQYIVVPNRYSQISVIFSKIRSTQSKC